VSRLPNLSRRLVTACAVASFAFIVGELVQDLRGQSITIPNTFINGTVADANQVNANFTALAANALNRNAGTMLGALNSQNILPTTDATYDLGSALFKFRDFYLSRNATIGGTTTLGGLTLTWPTSQSAGALLRTDGAGTLTWGSANPTQSFRGLYLRTHPDADVAASKVWFNADEIVMDDGTRTSSWAGQVADITVAGAGGLDTGAEAASTWYEVYALAKDDGTKSAVLHRSKDYLKDQEQAVTNSQAGLRSAAAATKYAQSFQLATAGFVDFVDIRIAKVGAPTGRVWLTLEASAAGVPSNTPLATSDKFDVSILSTTDQVVRFPFRTPTSLSTATTYFIVFQGDYTVSGVNYVGLDFQNTNVYANGGITSFDGATWTAVSVTSDFRFAVFVRRNDTTVTLPSGYTKKAKIGYVYNNSGSNFVGFVQRDTAQRRLTSTGNSTGALSLAAPQIIDLSTLVPPGPLLVDMVPFNGTLGNYVVMAGVPDGYTSVLSAPGDGGLIYVNVPGNSYGVSPATIWTDYQGMYAYTQAGAANVDIVGFKW
jgi:hypothetical protein